MVKIAEKNSVATVILKRMEGARKRITHHCIEKK
jgi:hypothetical protein